MASQANDSRNGEELPDPLSASVEYSAVGRTSITGSVNGGGEVKSNGSEQRLTAFVYLLTFFSALGGFLFGYDTGVVSGAMLKLSKEFDLSTWQEELLVSITIAAAAVASAIGGVLNDWLGRRPVLIMASLVFTGGAVLMAIAHQWEVLLVGRLIVGLGIGLASMTVPMYISEAAPLHVRGTLITLNNMFITGGQFVASSVDGLFANVPNGWRYMLGIGAIPSFIQFVGFLFLPESPRFLVKQRKFGMAQQVLQRIRGSSANIDKEFQSIQDECLQSTVLDQGAFNTMVRMFRSGPVRRALFVGCLLQACQQLTGINTLMYYSASIVKMAGVEDDTKAIWLAAAVAAGNLIFTMVGVYLVERTGRRKLMLGSLIGVGMALGVLGVGFYLARVQTPLALYDGNMPTTNSSCTIYGSCNWCTMDKHCGFCYVRDGNYKALNGTCQAVRHTANGKLDTKHSALFNSSYTDFGEDVPCVPAFSESSAGSGALNTTGTVAWAYDYCPTRYAWLIVAALVLYIAMFAPGMGPMPWTINAELYPLWARSTGNSASTFVNWSCNLVISMTFLSISETHTVGRAGAFWIYLGVAALCWIVLYRVLPETKGRSLEEAEKLFEKPWFGSDVSKHSDPDQYGLLRNENQDD